MSCCNAGTLAFIWLRLVRRNSLPLVMCSNRLVLLKHLPANAKVVEVGAGAGLPIIPCLIVRPDLEAVLIEASKKKSVFLREALRTSTPPLEAA